MDNKMSEPVNCSERKFDFYEIEWVIDNFCLATCNDKWRIQSPEFTIKGFHTTKWLMILKCGPSDTGAESLQLTMKRFSSDAGPETIWVDWRTNISRIDHEFGLDLLLFPFEKGMTNFMELGSLDNLIKTYKPFDSDSLAIRCKLIFFSDDTGKGFQPCRDIGIKRLSENLLQLFGGETHSDLKLIFAHAVKGIRIIPVHKVIVCSRIKEFNYLFEKSGRRAEGEFGEHDVLDLSFLSYNAMIRVMKYAYSGDIKYILQPDTLLAMYDCVKKLKISELKPYFTPNKLFFKTSVDNREFNLTWLIPDIRTVLNNEPIISPLFTDGCFGTSLQIHFAPRKESKSDFYGLYVETKEDKERMDACFDCAIADKNNDYYFVKRLRCSNEGMKMYGFDNYIRRNAVKLFADDNSLRIVVKLRLSNRLTSPSIEKQNISFVHFPNSDKCFTLLSEDMEVAFEMGFFSDVQLNIRGTSVNAHQCIIYARCRQLYDAVVSREIEGDENPFTKIESKIFRMLLKYLYTGIVINSGQEEDYIDLYDTAVKLKLTFLKDICSTFLPLMLESNPFIEQKVVEMAEKHQDEVLLESVKKCISELNKNKERTQ